MELWIRSQDKLSLIKVNKLTFERNIDDEPTIYGYEKYDNYERLGTYKTKERALEVLGEIQNILHPKIIVKKSEEELGNLKLEFAIKETESFSYDIEQLSTYVYEMPKE